MPQRCLATAIGSPGTLSGCPFSQEKGREAALEGEGAEPTEGSQRSRGDGGQGRGSLAAAPRTANIYSARSLRPH